MTLVKYLILGAGGQDGIISSHMLASRGCDVVAGVRVQPPSGHPLRLMLPSSQIVTVDVEHLGDLRETIKRVQPTRILNLAGQSNVRASWKNAQKTVETNVLGLLNVLQILIELRMLNDVRVYQASSSEVFGRARDEPQDESISLRPVTPYGVSKASAQQLAELYRDRYDVWIAVGILYNHESIYRSEDYVVRHVTRSVARIKSKRQHVLQIGNIDARRDWGYAPDYVDGMLKMLEHNEPENFILATGITHSVDDLLGIAFRAAGIDEWRRFVQVDQSRNRSVEPFRLVGDAAKARNVLGWETTCTFAEMVSRIVTHDIQTLGVPPVE